VPWKAPLATAVLTVLRLRAVDRDEWACLKKNDFSFAVVRCWQSNGVFDASCPDTIVRRTLRAGPRARGPLQMGR
jgi:hypothetical protein